MTSFDDKIWGLSILSWILIIIILVFFVYKVFYNNSDYDNSGAETFEETNADVSNGNVKVYNFNTSWCGWSVKFQPEWNKFTEYVSENSSLNNVKTFDVKCDKPENESVCKDFDIQGFPTVVIEAGGRRGLYKGPREVKDLIETVKNL
jgi:thiol-disulfide isomerase/thioredoxin